MKKAVRDLINTVETFVSQTDSPVWIAYSGGLDSTVLLHALSQSRQKFPTLSLHAIHVNHGLQVLADDWQSFCQARCEMLQVEFTAVNVVIAQTARRGIEAMARQKRYEALAQSMQGGGILVTAHHQRDQAETVLMSLARGAGPVGLSAMLPVTTKKIGHLALVHARPLLSVPYSAIQDYAEHYQLTWVDDPSNASCDFKRNAIRHEILPKFDQAWPFFEQNVAHSASYLAESVSLLDDLAVLDLQGRTCSTYCLSMEGMGDLSWARQKNIFSYWFRNVLFRPISATILEWLAVTLPIASDNNLPTLKLPHHETLRIYRQRLYFVEAPRANYRVKWCDLFNENLTTSSLDFPFDSLIDPYWLTQHRIHAAWLQQCSKNLYVRPIQVGDLPDMKPLKKWFKSNHIPPWQRSVWPVVVCENELVAVLGFQTFVKFSNAPDSHSEVI